MFKNYYSTFTTYIFKNIEAAAKFARDHHTIYFKTGDRYTVTITE